MPDSEHDGLNPYSTGYTVEDHVEELKSNGKDPYDHIYYTTYSWVYHTNPECPHLTGSDRVWVASSLYNLSLFPEPYVTGPKDVIHDLDECAWCANNLPEGDYVNYDLYTTENEDIQP